MVWFGEEVVGDAPLRAPIYPKGLLFTWHDLVWRRGSGDTPLRAPIYPKGILFTWHGLVWKRGSERRPTRSPHLSRRSLVYISWFGLAKR
jgi:hypothetical protein